MRRPDSTTTIIIINNNTNTINSIIISITTHTPRSLIGLAHSAKLTRRITAKRPVALLLT